MANTIVSDSQLQNTVAALKQNGMSVLVVDTKEDAKKAVVTLVPEGSEVFTMTSVTLDTIGIPEILNNPEKYSSIRVKYSTMDRNTQKREMTKLGAAPDYAVGSAHAVTEDGKVLVASNTGSQLPAYVYGAGKVIWVIGIQKLVKDVDAGLKRINDYILPLESERLSRVYGKPIESFVSKLLIVNRETVPDRVNIIIVKEPVGF